MAIHADEHMLGQHVMVYHIMRVQVVDRNRHLRRVEPRVLLGHRAARAQDVKH